MCVKGHEGEGFHVSSTLFEQFMLPKGRKVGKLRKGAISSSNTGFVASSPLLSFVLSPWSANGDRVEVSQELAISLAPAMCAISLPA